MQNKGLHEKPAFMSVATGLAPANAPASMYVDMLLNKGCFNPASSAGTRWSMYSYGLVPAENVPRTSTNPKSPVQHGEEVPRVARVVTLGGSGNCPGQLRVCQRVLSQAAC